MKRIIELCMLVAVCMGLHACNDWLDVQPAEEMGVEDMFASEAGFKDALTACYIKMYSDNLYGKNLTQSNIEYLAQHWETPDMNGEDIRSMKNFEYDAETVESTFSSVYSEMYNVIAQANAVLNKLPEYGGNIESPAMRKLIEGELLAIRAFCHSDILRLFGQVPGTVIIQVSLPYVEEVTIESLEFFPFDRFVEKIFADIHAAEELLKEVEPLTQYTFAELDDLANVTLLEDEFFLCRRFRFNYYALKALEARLQLYLGDETKAYELAMEVINAKTETGNALLTLGGEADFAQRNFALPSECLLALNKSDLSNLDNSLYMTEGGVDEIFEGQQAEHNRKGALWQKTLVNSEERMLLQKYRQPDASEMVGD